MNRAMLQEQKKAGKDPVCGNTSAGESVALPGEVLFVGRYTGVAEEGAALPAPQLGDERDSSDEQRTRTIVSN